MPDDDEHCVIYAMFPQQLEALWNKKNAADPCKRSADNPAPSKSEKPSASGEVKHYNISINGENIAATVEVVR